MGNSRFSHFTPRLLLCVFTYSWGSVLYGLDTGSFGALQALPSFLDQFGVLHADGTYKLPTGRRSIMNSIPFVGKLVGCFLFEPLVGRLGYKKLMLIVLTIQTIGVVLEMAAKEWVMFTVGRVTAYLAVGMVENACPSYESEVAPAQLRGFISGSLIMLTTLGNLWGGLMGRAFESETHRIGWLIPTAMQLIPVLLIAIGLPFTPESPRWLVLQGRNDEALTALNKLRTQSEINAGNTQYEVAAFEQAIEEDKLLANQGGSWFDLFRSTYRRRTLIAMFMFIFQQTTGGQFLLSYGPTFYKLVGLGEMAFTYNVLLQALSFVGCFITIFLLDKVGRRPFLVVGTFLQIPFMLIVAGLGTRPNPTRMDVNGMIACIMLFNICVKVSLSTNAYLIASEIGGTRMRKKVMSIATATDVAGAFTVTYSLPYVLASPPFTGRTKAANVGWIFGGIATGAFIFVTFFVPELAGRSLEEVDELFAANIWAWQFKNYKSSGVGARIRELERGDRVENHEIGGEKDVDLAMGNQEDLDSKQQGSFVEHTSRV